HPLNSTLFTYTTLFRSITVDTGFLVYNESRYHHFKNMLNRYGVATEASDMSFAVSNRVTGLEYNATSVGGLFCDKKNLVSGAFRSEEHTSELQSRENLV